MADVTITSLPTYATGTNPGPNDVIPIVDLATNTTRKVPFSAFGGGGGGGSFTGTAVWTTANSTSKNAYTSQPTVNNDGITINLAAAFGSGSITSAAVRLNAVALANTYSSTGSFPNYVITVPVADLINNSAQVAPTVSISVTGTFNGANFSVANAGTLTNVQPTPFTTTLSGAYSPSSLPFYTTTSTITYAYTNSNAITSFGGTITPTGGFSQGATSPSGSIANQPINGATIGGNATGTGLNGAGSTTVGLSGSISAVTTFIPAWLSQTANNTPPTFATTNAVVPANPATNTSYQSAGAAQGTTLTYPAATVAGQYNWICTQRPLANLLLVTPFGNSQLVPDVTAPTQTLGGQLFNVYGWTALTVGSASVLQIT